MEHGKQAFLKMVKALHKGVQNLPIGWTNFLKNCGMTDEEISQAEKYESLMHQGNDYLEAENMRLRKALEQIHIIDQWTNSFRTSLFIPRDVLEAINKMKSNLPQ